MHLKPLETKNDRRGSLVEAFKFPNDGQLFYVIINPGEMRGNHYHQRKVERFLVIWGDGEIQVRDRTTENIMKVGVNGHNPMVVTIVPNHTHSITAGEEGCILLVWVDEIFNEADADTFMEEI